MKKIYFACSIRSGRDDVEIYKELVLHIKASSIVLTEIFASNKLTPQGSPGKSSDIYKKDLKLVKQADGIIAEVTNPSLGVGYEIATAEMWNKPVLALFRDEGTKRLSAMIDGSPKTRVIRYKEVNEALLAIDEFIGSILTK